MPDRNRLAEATSPYLLQHRDNPVHWHEWGQPAFAEARRKDVPVLLSVGYASCHWCHVMAHESFEDDATADLMNRWFVNVKVDREERPDVDRVYMDAVQALSGQGGWPMTVFLTPEGKPFFAGTYFPKVDRHGHPAFTKVLEAVHQAWEERREEVRAQSDQLVAAVSVQPSPKDSGPTEGSLAAGYDAIARVFDRVSGGFGGAPKFPQAPTLEFLMRAGEEPWAPEATAMLEATLEGMIRGGIRDRIGGGFARYSVDARWTVPHFEKMLYDNALLARQYALASQAVRSPRFADTARRTLEYMLNDLRLSEGGFSSGEDADSEGAEGTFYVFSADEVAAAAGDSAGPVMRALGVTAQGNFEGRNVLYDAEPSDRVADEFGVAETDVDEAIAATLEALGTLRATRLRPGRDDKVVAAWNGLAIRALADAGTALSSPDYVAAAAEAADFVLKQMRRPDGRLLRTWRAGRHGPPGFCDDYGALALGCFSLYRATGATRWYAHGAELTESMVELFRDDADGGFFSSGRDAERLIARPKNLFDNPTPSDNSLAAEAMLHMAAFTGEDFWWKRLDGVMRLGAGFVDSYPVGSGQMMAVALTAAAPPLEVALVGDDAGALTAVVLDGYRPSVFLARGTGSDGSTVPLLESRPMIDGAPTAYVCRGFVCNRPTTDPAELRAALSSR